MPVSCTVHLRMRAPAERPRAVSHPNLGQTDATNTRHTNSLIAADSLAMERLRAVGGFEAINAFTVTDDGTKAYYHDPYSDVIYSVNLETGARRILKWEDRSFQHRRWLLYSMFSMQKGADEYLSVLFFNNHKKMFCLVHFYIERFLLVKRQTNALNTQTLNLARLAYTAHKDGNLMQMILYERFSRVEETPEEATPLHYVYAAFDCESMRLSARTGLLPRGQWEVPFVGAETLYFVSTARSPHLLASCSLASSADPSLWSVQPIQADDDCTPPRKAMWCNAWRNGVCWYSVSEKVAINGTGSGERESIDSEEAVKRTRVWKLDPIEAQWTKLPAFVDSPCSASNFAFRVANGDTAILHFDSQNREAEMYRVLLQPPTPPAAAAPLAASERSSEEQTEKEENKPSSSRNPLDDITCPICLEFYDDPRTLQCGHSFCWNCIETMRLNSKTDTVRCPNCRSPTTVPARGLPVNYGLQDALAMLVKMVDAQKHELKCALCPKRCIQSEMWTCLTCMREAEPVGAEPAGAESDRFAPYSHCANCLLSNHRGHEHENLEKLRARGAAAEKERVRLEGEARELTQTLTEEGKKQLEDMLQQSLLEPVCSALTSLSDIVHYGEEDMEARSATIMARLGKVKESFGEQLRPTMKKLLDCCVEAATESEKPRPLSRPVSQIEDTTSTDKDQRPVHYRRNSTRRRRERPSPEETRPSETRPSETRPSETRPLVDVSHIAQRELRSIEVDECPPAPPLSSPPPLTTARQSFQEIESEFESIVSEYQRATVSSTI